MGAVLTGVSPMRRALPLFLLAAPAWAAPTDDWSARIGAEGLAATEAALTALAEPTPDDLFALGAVRFLGGIEAALHRRWTMGEGSQALGMIPVLRLPVPPNPAPQAFDPGTFDALFADLVTDMDAAREPLAAIPDGAGVALPVRLGDLWLDIDGDGARDEAEGLAVLALRLLTGTDAIDAAQLDAVIRFDDADVAWLSAYTHMLAGIGSLAGAFPTEAVLTEVWDGRKRMNVAGYAGPLGMGGQMMGVGPSEIDLIATALMTLRQEPDAAMTQAARDHWLGMIADNLTFWARVEAETDDEAEWIPNEQQVSALTRAPLPDGMGENWRAILKEAERILRGEVGVPLPNMMDGSVLSFDLATWLDDPAPLDLVTVLHGMGLVDYIRPVAPGDQQSWDALGTLTANQPFTYAVWLN